MRARYFSIAEANALLDTVRPIIEKMMAARQRIVAAQPELWPILEKALGNGGGKKAGELLGEFETIQNGVRTLESMGIHVKDVNTGLIDFLHERDGRDVYLCWRYNESAITYWHDLDAGFAGRQPL